MDENYKLENAQLYTKLTGKELIHSPILNKGTVFSETDREQFQLEGLLPPHVDSVEEQLNRCYQSLLAKPSDLDKYIFLRQLQDQNETLFYMLAVKHLEEVMPLIYTPTVGEGCQLFSSIYRRARGLFIAYPERDKISKILDNSPIQDAKVIVVTDGERILGLGDQGVGGMGIPIGKLSLYSACGGIHPEYTLPVILDVGTNNQERLNDPSYLGWRHERITGEKYYEFVDLFVQAIKKKFPGILLQFEDFAQPHAYPLLGKYRDQLCCFNDDIQGTASVCVGALLAAAKTIKGKISDHRVAVLGAGSAGCGISEQIVQAMIKEGLSEEEARTRFYMVNKEGLLLDNTPDLKPFQKGLVQKASKVENWKLKKPNYIGLEDVVIHAKPTILLGVSGQPNLFTESIIRAMAKGVEHPIIFPMSNPTSRCEAIPSDILKWTDGKAIVATGSPFEDVKYKNATYTIAQSNNCYIFPGMGLGIIASKATHVSDEMFMAASEALSEASPALRDPKLSLLPPLSKIRELSLKIAFAVAKQAQKEGRAKQMSDAELKQAIQDTMWEPQYYPLHKM